MPIVSPMGQLRPAFADKNGKRLSGGKVYTYEPGTLTPKPTYSDALGTLPNPNPINLDESGEADIYLDGNYRFIVLDRYGVMILDRDNFRTWASGIPAESIIVSEDGSTQQEINDFGGAKWRNKPLGYDIGSTVKLENGDIVKSTIANNIINPNVDMTGWVKTTDASQIFDESGKSQQDVNDLQAVHNKSFVSITDIATNSEIGAALSQMGLLGISKIKIPSGDWNISTPVVITNDIEFDVDLNANIIIKTGGSLKFEGSSSLIASYIQSVSKNTYVLDNIDASGLSSGDLICLYDPTDFSFSNARAYYRKGEFLEVRKVLSPTSVQLTSRPLFNYTKFDLYKINPIQVCFNRFSIKNEAGVSIPVLIDFGRNIQIEQYSNDTALDSGITIQRSYNMQVNNISPRNISSASGTNYGLTLSNCQLWRVDGGLLQGTRHSVTIGGIDAPCAIPTQQGKIICCNLYYDGTTNTFAADMHGNANHIEYINCTLDGAQMSGMNAKLVNCTIDSRLLDNLAISGSDIAGGYMDIIDCTLICHGAPATAYGYIAFVMVQKLKSDLHINIKNLTLVCDPTLNTGLQVVRVQSSVPQDYEVNVIIDGIQSNALCHGITLRCLGVDTVNGFENVLKMGRCHIDNIAIAQDGYNSYYAFIDPVFANEGLVDLSLPAQRGYVEQAVAGETTGIVGTPAVFYKYLYPRPPNVFTTISPPSGEVNDAEWLAANQNLTVGVSSSRTEKMSMTIRSDKTMPSAVVRVNWMSMI